MLFCKYFASPPKKKSSHYWTLKKMGNVKADTLWDNVSFSSNSFVQHFMQTLKLQSCELELCIHAQVILIAEN